MWRHLSDIHVYRCTQYLRGNAYLTLSYLTLVKCLAKRNYVVHVISRLNFTFFTINYIYSPVIPGERKCAIQRLLPLHTFSLSLLRNTEKVLHKCGQCMNPRTAREVVVVTQNYVPKCRVVVRGQNALSDACNVGRAVEPTDL